MCFCYFSVVEFRTGGIPDEHEALKTGQVHWLRHLIPAVWNDWNCSGAGEMPLPHGDLALFVVQEFMAGGVCSGLSLHELLCLDCCASTTVNCCALD